MFKIGDRVRRTGNRWNNVSRGQIYIVIGTAHESLQLKTLEDKNISGNYGVSKFELYSDIIWENLNENVLP